jgi:hypothetical protein
MDEGSLVVGRVAQVAELVDSQVDSLAASRVASAAAALRIFSKASSAAAVAAHGEVVRLLVMTCATTCAWSSVNRFVVARATLI